LNDKQRTKLRASVIGNIARAQSTRTPASERAILLQDAEKTLRAVMGEEWVKHGKLPEQFREAGPGLEIQVAAEHLQRACDALGEGDLDRARRETMNAIKVSPRIS
jgi:hypothetical protein